MNEHTSTHRDRAFAIGLLTGTCVGVGLALWFAPRLSSELRARVSDSALNLGQQASDRLEHATARIGDVVGEVARKGQGVRNDLADAVARGAREVERLATAAKGRPATAEIS